MVAGGGSASSVVTWACGQSGSASVPRVRYGMDWGRSVAPEPVQALVVTHLQGLAPDHRFSRRLDEIAKVILARVGPKSWRAYASHFAAFVRFCVAEELEFLPALPYTGLLWAQYLAARGTVQASSAQPYFSAINTIHELLGFPKPCTGDNPLFVAFRRGWERMQVSVLPRVSLNLAFSAGDLWSLCEALPG
ncbi:hypothetical protein Vafri_1889, partial [Volvox africanus]